MEEPKSYSIEKLNESNYRSWSQVIESHLDDQELWEGANGSVKAPTVPTAPTATETDESRQRHATATEEYDTAMTESSKKTKKARKLIISTISPSVMTYVEGTRDPSEVSKILEERY